MVLRAFHQIPEIDKYIFIAKEDRMDATRELSFLGEFRYWILCIYYILITVDCFFMYMEKLLHNFFINIRIFIRSLYTSSIPSIHLNNKFYLKF